MTVNVSLEVDVLEVGFGNLPSLSRVLRQIGVSVNPIGTSEEILAAKHLIVPGVGSFRSASLNLRKLGLFASLRKRCLELSRPTLGICLGAQILFEEGIEGGMNEGVGVFSGSVQSIKEHLAERKSHTGWDRVQIVKPLLGFSSGDCIDVYFNHDYIFVPRNFEDVYAFANHGGEFPVILKREMTYAVQFHPEKSQKMGLNLLKSFIDDSGGLSV